MIRDEYMKQCAAASVKEHDRIIVDRFRDITGEDCFAIANLSKRMAIEVYPGGREVVVIDGVPRLEFFPPTFDAVGLKLSIMQHYRFL